MGAIGGMIGYYAGAKELLGIQSQTSNVESGGGVDNGNQNTNPDGNDEMIFDDGFESAELGNWEEVVVPDARNKDVVNWQITEDAIDGSYAAYCDTVGDANHLRTKNAIINTSSPFEVSYKWSTSDQNSRGIGAGLVNGETGSDFDRRIRFRIGLDVDGNPRVQAGGEEQFFSNFDYNQAHETAIRYENGEFSIHLNSRELMSVNEDISGEYHLGFNSSGHYGSPSNVTLDTVQVSRL